MPASNESLLQRLVARSSEIRRRLRDTIMELENNEIYYEFLLTNRKSHNAALCVSLDGFKKTSNDLAHYRTTVGEQRAAIARFESSLAVNEVAIQDLRRVIDEAEAGKARVVPLRRRKGAKRGQDPDPK